MITSVLVGVVVGSLIGRGLPSLGWTVHLLSGWNAAGLTLLARVWWRILNERAEDTCHLAAGEDPGRTLVWLLVLLGNTVSLFAAGFVLRHAHSIAPNGTAFAVLCALCLGAVITAWLLTHTAYALRYAHLYYRDDDEGQGGLEFPGGLPPDALDFAYFSLTLGMCFQTSDVTITSRQLRRATLAHTLLSFVYNTVVLALALNLAFGLV